MELAVLASCKMDLKQTAQPVIQNTPQVQVSPIQNAKMMAINAQAPIQKPAPAPIQVQQQPIAQTQTVEPMQVQPAPVPQIQQTQVPEQIAQNQDSAQIWSTIVSAIPSLPTRAFYSGVAKLVGIQDKTIKLGFLNDNVLNGAKSSAKLPMLEKAIEATYAGYSVEFIRIDSSTKVVEVKPKIAPPQPTRPIEKPIEQAQQAQEQSSSDSEEEQTSAKEKRQYSPKVQDMIEQFNGRIID